MFKKLSFILLLICSTLAAQEKPRNFDLNLNQPPPTFDEVAAKKYGGNSDMTHEDYTNK